MRLIDLCLIGPHASLVSRRFGWECRCWRVPEVPVRALPAEHGARVGLRPACPCALCVARLSSVCGLFATCSRS
jgi:hypothetical protein